MSKLYTTREAADYLHLSPRSVRVYVTDKTRRNQLTPISSGMQGLAPEVQRLLQTSDYLFTEEELKRFDKARGKVGKPKKDTQTP